MRFAYADPPYLGLAARFYGDRHPDAADYDEPAKHAELIERLCSDYDGWAMHLHTPSLRTILPMCPEDVRVAAWCKSFASFKPGVNPVYAWEPVLFRSAGRSHDRTRQTVNDFCLVPITLERGFQGAKPEAVVHWVMRMLGVQSTDTVEDLFPGSGAVQRAIDSWQRQAELQLL